MKRLIPALLIACLATVLLGASSWEGSAMMSAYGEFPESGYYAACNSFPRNTAVEVVNLENGKTVTVIVTKGLENPGIFLLLSPEAAKAIAMEPGALSRVRVSAPRNIADIQNSPAPGGDPDFNPSLLAARSGGYKPAETPALEAKTVEAPEPAPEAAELQPPAEQPQEQPAAVEEAAPAPAPEEPAPPAPELVEAPKAEEKLNVREAPVSRPEVYARTAAAPERSAPVTAPIPVPADTAAPEAQEGNAVVYGLERPETLEQPVNAALADPALIPDELPEAALTRLAWPEDPAPSAALADLEIRMDDSGRPEALARTETPEEPAREPEIALAEPAGKVQPEPAPAPPEAAPAAAPEPAGEVVVSMEPAAPKPPAPAPKPSEPAAPAPAAVAAAPARPEAAPPSSGLLPGKYYIQVGAYKTSSALASATKRLSDSFPVTVDSVQSGSSQIFRLFVGPLGRDETGVALLKVQSLGFKEAFLKN